MNIAALFTIGCGCLSILLPQLIHQTLIPAAQLVQPCIEVIALLQVLLLGSGLMLQPETS